MSEHRTGFSVQELCRVFELSHRGYYRWINRQPSQRDPDNWDVDAHSAPIHAGSKGRYCSPKIARDLHDKDLLVSKNRVARRMRLCGLRSKIRRKCRVTTDSRQRFPVAQNLLERNFTAQVPNEVWVSGISYLTGRWGWLYLAVIIDLLSRLVVGWSLSSSLSHEMVVTAHKRAERRRHPPPELVFNSGVGFQYACSYFR
jgi:transposase InsO family protein